VALTVNKQIIIRQTQVGQWFGYAGGAGLMAALVGFIAQSGLTEFVGIALTIGLIGLFFWAALAPADFRAFVSGRQMRYSTGAVFGTLLLLGVVALTYVILQRAVITLDMTEGQRFSLSTETRAVLNRVVYPMRITGFYSPRLLSQREIDDQFFRLYEVETDGLITREYIDPEQQPALAQRYSVTFDGEIFLSYVNADGSTDFSTTTRVPISESQERDMTGAIARQLISGTLTVYFERSHGERDPLDSTQEGMSGINGGIQESGLITQPFDLQQVASVGGDLPTDASAFILARPLTDFSDSEIAVIDRYLKRGGALFIMSDVLFNADAFLRQDGKFNQFLWNNYGLRALDAAIVDPVSSQDTPLDIVSAAVYTDSAIAARLDSGDTPTLFRLARAVEISSNPPANTPNGRIVLSSPQSYGETNLKQLGETNTYAFDPEDIQGPLTSVAWAYNQKTGAKILLVGDSDFATNGQVLTGGNSILFTDGVAWLTGYGDQINYAPQAYRTGLPLMFVTGQTLDAIAFVTVILMPGLVLLTGFIVWTRRIRA
jgi:hypothetical protein